MRNASECSVLYLAWQLQIVCTPCAQQGHWGVKSNWKTNKNKFCIRGSVHRNSRLMQSNEMQQYDLYHRLQLQFYVLLMMRAMDARNM